MKIENKITSKRAYIAPEIEIVILDNEISLTLDSNPFPGPNEGNNSMTPEFLNNDPFRNNRA